MTCPKEQKLADFRDDYASPGDFCRVLELDMKPLYLLSFLLTANHQKAAQCFATTAAQALEEPTVFKEWTRSWIKRCLIKNAISIAFTTSEGKMEDREFWSARLHGGAGSDSEIDAVAQLPVLERCVFVMSTLERYSDWECSVLLGCGSRKLVKARVRALGMLAQPVAFIARCNPPASALLECGAGRATCPDPEHCSQAW
jgi:hypothetical protein